MSRTAAQIEEWMVERLAAQLATEPTQVDVEQPFAAFGLDSAAAMQVTGGLEEWLGVKLPATLMWDYPNIRQLSQYLASMPEAKP